MRSHGLVSSRRDGKIVMYALVALWLAVLADMGTSIAVTLNGLRLFKRGYV